MAKYILRVEAVNIYDLIKDTQNLSTIRGAGLMILDAAGKIENMPDNSKEVKIKKIETISTGASIGMFSFEADDEDKAEDFRNKVAKFLSNDSNLMHATFVVDIQPILNAGSFMKDYEKVIAKNRWRQFQQLTVVLPEENSSNDVRICALDKLRPGTCEETIQGEIKSISTSVSKRFNYGKDQKQKFYENQLEKLGVVLKDKDGNRQKFTTDFKSLSSNLKRGNLHHKIAVIYLDGNKFGTIRNRLCQTPEDLTDFDKTLKTHQRKFLKALVKDRMLNDSGYITDDKKLRIETLLWGGDEMMWVVPAWKGWSVLGTFYESSKEWQFQGEPLTHAAGLVFCHHNAPIHRVTSLCRDLADKVKANKDRPAGNEFQYVVMESFDHIGQDIEKFRSTQVPFNYQYTLDGNKMGKIAYTIRNLIKELPRNQVYNAIRAAIEDTQNIQSPEKLEAFNDRLEEVLGTSLKHNVDNLLSNNNIFGQDPRGWWIHLAELWDYIPEEREL